MTDKTSNRYAHIALVVVVMVWWGLLCSLSVQAGTKWTNDAGDNAWNNPRNWDPEGVPTDQTYMSVGLSGEDRAIVKERPDKSDFHLNVKGELDVEAPFAPERSNRYVDLYEGGIINVYSDFYPKGNGLRFRGGGRINLHEGSVRIDHIEHRDIKERYGFTVHGGTLAVRSNLPLKPRGELHIKGGTVKVTGDVQLSKRSRFHVIGGKSDAIRIGGDWVQLGNSTLHLKLGSNGITPIEVDGDVAFAEPDGVTLNVESGDEPAYGSGKVMTWDGKLKEENLQFADSVDESVWKFKLHENDNGGGYMTLAHRKVNGLKVTDLHVPERATLGEEVRVAARVANATGAEHTETVKLLIDGEVQKQTDVTLAAGGSDTVHFTHTISDRTTGTSDVRVATADHYADDVMFRVREGGLIDHVNFGNAESEQAASLEAKSADASTGGLEQTYRYLSGADGNASLTFRLTVQPYGENYITLKFWGSEYEEKPVKERYSHNMPVVLKLGEEGRTIPPQGGPNRDKAIPTDPGNYSADSLEKNRRPQFAKRFFYVTYKIPDGVVGSDQTKLQIKIVGNKGNYGTNLSPGIYRAYTHTDPFFEPMDDEPRGTKPEAKLKEPPSAERKTERNNNRIESAMSYQYYGSPWDEWVEEGKMPAYLYGAFEKHGGKKPNPERVQDWDEETWRTFLGTFPNEIRPARQFLEVAHAYNIEHSDYYRDEEILDRVVQALDVAVVAQGSNGGWGFRRPDQDVGRPTGWLGVPDRQVASAGLYPGLKHFVHAFQEVQSALQEKGFLDEPLNHDLDPDTPPIPRRTAYERMFEGVRALYVSDCGQQGVTNQQLHNLEFAVRANRVLQKMGNKGWGVEQKWTDEMLPQGLSVHPDFEGVNSFAEMIKVVSGLKENAEGTREFSPSGMPNEAGYSSGYGRGSVGQIASMADVSGYPPVEKVAEKAKEAFSHFRYPSFDPDGYKLMRWEGIISARGGRFYPGEPAGYVYKGNEFAPPAPMLGDDDVMWTDPYIGLIAMKHNGNRMYLKLNWRGAWRERGGDQSFKADDITSGVSGLARIHYTTDKVDRFGSVHMEAPYGYRRLYEMNYGDYLIRMNLSRKHTYPINIPERLHGVEALDLVSGKRGKLKDGIKLGPRTTRVFYIGNK